MGALFPLMFAMLPGLQKGASKVGTFLPQNPVSGYVLFIGPLMQLPMFGAPLAMIIQVGGSVGDLTARSPKIPEFSITHSLRGKELGSVLSHMKFPHTLSNNLELHQLTNSWLIAQIFPPAGQQLADRIRDLAVHVRADVADSGRNERLGTAHV